MPAIRLRPPQYERSRRPSPLGVDDGGIAQWVPRVAGAFQELVLLARTGHIDEAQLAGQLARIPAPRNPLESLIIRYFIDDCLIAVFERTGSGQSPASLRHFAEVMTAVHRERNPLAELAKALCETNRGDSDAALANTIKARIEKEIGRRLTARTIAVEYRIGRAQLDRVFRDRFGVGFHRYLTSMRVRRGLDLVMSGMKVEAAGVSVGYKSKKDFYRAVREETGSTPGKLRRSVQLSSEKKELMTKQGTLFGLT
jgi:AraC-like DNA-binding protein